MFVSLGLNCLRLPFNYRHFEDDMNPFVFKESGFKHLDRVINIVSSYSFGEVDESALPMEFIRFWIFIPHLDVKTSIGIPTTHPLKRYFGNMRIFKTVQLSCGNRSPNGMRVIRGWRVTILSTNRRMNNMYASSHGMNESRKLFVKSIRIIFYFWVPFVNFKC